MKTAILCRWLRLASMLIVSLAPAGALAQTNWESYLPGSGSLSGLSTGTTSLASASTTSLAAYNVGPSTVTVAGLSSGGYMAVQLDEYQRECDISLDAAAGLQLFNRAYRDEIDILCEIEIVADVARRHFGEIPMAVASGGTREIVKATLLSTNLLALFDAVVTIEDVQGRGKPAPDIFLEAARRLRVSPNECTVFEDSDEGIEAARLAGMTATDVRLVYRPAWRFGTQEDDGKSQ